jgi:hypothetical protein
MPFRAAGRSKARKSRRLLPRTAGMSFPSGGVRRLRRRRRRTAIGRPPSPQPSQIAVFCRRLRKGAVCPAIERPPMGGLRHVGRILASPLRPRAASGPTGGPPQGPARRSEALVLSQDVGRSRPVLVHVSPMDRTCSQPASAGGGILGRCAGLSDGSP